MTSKNAVRKLLEIYLDENIIIYLRDMNVVAINESQGEVKISAMIEGYVVDIDQDYFYLGSSSDGVIVKTIPHHTIGLIELAVEASPLNSDMAEHDEDVH
jgi:hypothetical protein